VQVNAKNKTLNQSWTFDATQFNLRNFDETNNAVAELATLIAGVLASEDEFLLLDINCFVQVGIAQEVYPSEELVLDKGKGEKSKILYDVNDIAAMHSQKIGNAIRTIDTWYPEFKKQQRVISIDPYGAVTNLGKAYRQPKAKKDFFNLFDAFSQGEALDSVEDKHFVMAVLVRGGVFGEKQ